MNQKVIDSFDRAASEYHNASTVQRRIAQHLSKTLFLETGKPESVFEIGCGTGNLTRLLVEQWRGSSFLITDASAAMVSQAREQLGDLSAQNDIRFQRFIAGKDQLQEGFSLVVSNMTLQWLEDLPRELNIFGSHSNTIAFSIPLDGSFSRWIKAHQKCGLDPGIRALMPLSRLKEELDSLSCRISFFEVRDFPARFDHPLDFARSLRKTGTSVPRAGHQPVNLRRVIACLPDQLEINYRIAIVILDYT